MLLLLNSMHMNYKRFFRQLHRASFVWVGVLAMCALLCASCRRKVDEHEAVRAATQHYFGLLLSGDTQGFLSGMANADSLPPYYRQQMENLVAQYAASLGERGGMVKAVATHDSIIDSLAYVFMDVTFADSITERMMVRMVRKGKEWKMM